jgi:uncharacterized protein
MKSNVIHTLCYALILGLLMMPKLSADEAHVTGCSGPKERLHVYLLIGGEGMAGPTALTADADAVLERCYLLNAEGTWEPARASLNRYSTIAGTEGDPMLGPGLAFAKAMLEADKEVSIGLVVNAGAGKQNFVEHWRYKDECYRQARKRTRTACKTGTLKGVLWHQTGNRIDSALSYHKDLIGNLRADFGLLNLPFIVGGMPEADDAVNAHNSMNKALVADVHASAIASAEGVSQFDAPGMELLGNRYAEQMMSVQAEWAAKPIRQAVPEPKVIDAHIHATPCKKDGLDIVATWMERNHVERCISKPLSQSRAKTPEEREIMLANFLKYKGRIDRFCIIKPHEVESVEEAVAILKKEKAEGAIGFGEHYGVGMMFDDPRNLRLYAACEQVGLPVHFHIDSNKNMDEKGLPRLERVLKTFPNLNLIAHAAFWLELSNGTCDRLLQTYPNLYAEPSGHRMAAILNRDRIYTRDFLIRNADKILFGTDAGWWSFGKAKADREIQFTLFEELDLPEEVLAKIYRGNAEKLFGFNQ